MLSTVHCLGLRSSYMTHLARRIPPLLQSQRHQARNLAAMAEAASKSVGPTGVQTTSMGEEKLPKLSADDYRTYNGMAEHMEYFHNHFRQTWNVLYSACEKNERPSNMSLRQFLYTGTQFCSHLEVHHSIEERHIFPVLAQKMPAFRQELELLTQHKQIHKGLDVFQAYLEACTAGKRELRLGELKILMDGFGEVLWAHLSDEVKQLDAENMRKYWSVKEMKRMPM